METPVFRLGLVGFDAREEKMLREAAGRYRPVSWQCGQPEGADAWVVNGARVARVQGTTARVITSRQARDGAALVLDVASRPTVVAAPVPQALEQLACQFFSLADADTFRSCLADLDGRLSRLRRMYWVAAHLVKCNDIVGKAIYELRMGAELLAIADMKGTVSVFPGLREQQIAQAAWKHRARKLLEVPGDFEQCSIAEMLWTYATRTRLDLLPEHYREVPLYLRRPPRVATELLDDVHLQVVRELAVAPARFPDLMDRTDIDPKELAPTLAALYYVGSITSNPERAWAASHSSSAWASRTSRMEEAGLRFTGSPEGQPSTTPLF